MEGLNGRLVFSVGSTEFRWEDVVLAAELWGEADRLRQRVREQVACLASGADESEVDALLADAVKRAADEFRYDRDLVAAEEMEDWLARWDLSAERWMDYIRGSVLRDQRLSHRPDLVAPYEPSDNEIEMRMEAAAICSGMLKRVAHNLAERAAVHDTVADTASDNGDGSHHPWPFPVKKVDGTWPGLDPEFVRRRVTYLARLERAYDRFCDECVTPVALDALIREAQLAWTRLQCQSVSFSEEGAAREAVLCMQDGQRLEELAAESHRTVHDESIWIEGVDEPYQDRFLGAKRGDIIGPIPRDDQFGVYHVLDKIAPARDDRLVADRARTRLVTRLVQQAMNDRVKWHLQF